MTKELTRRQFLKLSGQTIAVTGVACALLSGPANPRAAHAQGVVELDGCEMVARVGDTFATIQLVPRFTKGQTPVGILAKVQYGTDPTFASYSESDEVSADNYVWEEKGKHVGKDGSSELKVKKKFEFLTWDWEIVPGDLIYNKTDGSTMVVSAVVSDRKVAGELSGGVNNVSFR